MKFDIVIGNPPYNNDIYLDFITLGNKLSKEFTCMITPAKWQAKTDGKQKINSWVDRNEQFRQDIVPYMSHIVFYKDSTDVFDIQEWGGISYFLIDKIRHPIKNIKNICSKSEAFSSDFELHDEENVILYNSRLLSVIEKVRRLENIFTHIGNDFELSRQIYVGEQDTGENTKVSNGRNYVEVMQGEKVVGYKKVTDLFTTLNLDKYKCICSIMPGAVLGFDSTNKIIGMLKISIIGPNQVPKGSFPILRYFNNRQECESFISYMNCKLVAFLFFLGACGTTLTREFFRFIPNQNNWGIVYEDKPIEGISVEDIDEHGVYTDRDGIKHCALYIKYKLSNDEIEIIEGLMKDRRDLSVRFR